MKYEIYNIFDYKLRADKFKDYSETYKTIEELEEVLKHKRHYHERLSKDGTYIYFLDIDDKNEDENPDLGHDIIQKFRIFMLKYYKLRLNDEEFNLTQNTEKKNSYHITCPSIYASCKKLKEITSNFKNNIDESLKHTIDTSVYTDKWFRLPNQIKGTGNKTNIHKIKNGNIRDFILQYIPKDSININDYQFIKEEEKKKKEKKEKNLETDTINQKKQDINIVKDLLDILSDKYYDEYNNWIKIAMILNKYEKNIDFNLFDTFDIFSQKSIKYNKIKTEEIYYNLNNYNITLNINSLHYFAIDSNKEEYKKIMKKYEESKYINISEAYLAKTIKKIAGHLFFYKNNILYSFDTKNNRWFVETTNILKRFINDDLYDYLKELINNMIENKDVAIELKNELTKMCTHIENINKILHQFEMRFFDEMYATDIHFDKKSYLLGFLNGVYDLKSNIFRKYEYTDYITTHTGYVYKEGTKEEIDKIKQIFEKIEPNQDRYKLLFQILGTGLIGKSYHKFILFNGIGGNGKSLTSSFMKHALGNYFYKAPINILCEKLKPGGNPELAHFHNKRYIVFSEPSENHKIINGVLKSISGDETINARMLFSNNTEVNLMATIILECNKKIYLAEDPTEGDIRRLIDYPYESKFTDNKNLIDESNRIYPIDTSLDIEFIQTHKYAFLSILIEYAHNFLTRDNEIFKIPDEIALRSNNYIKSSYSLLSYLDEYAEKTNSEDDYISLGSLFNYIISSETYKNSTKEERVKIKKHTVINFFENNSFTMQNFVKKKNFRINDKITSYYNLLVGYKILTNINNDILL